MTLGFDIVIGVVLYGACILGLASAVCQPRPLPPHWPSPLEAHMAMMAARLRLFGVTLATALQPAMARATSAFSDLAKALATTDRVGRDE